MKRKPYEKTMLNCCGISTKNEPLAEQHIHVNARYYPDMHAAYDNFSTMYGIRPENFILTNGCESALRIALLALRPAQLTIERPTWARVAVECEALGIAYDYIDYLYKDGSFYPAREAGCGCLYTTDSYNNLFQHQNIKGSAMTVLDETYTSKTLFAAEKNFCSDTIIIGSFSKTVGAGLRLGYCLFADTWAERFHLLREQYLSAAACAWLATGRAVEPQVIHDIALPYPIVTRHPVYITVAAQSLPIPHKHFQVSGVDFCRLGTKSDMNDLMRILNDRQSLQ